MTVTPVPISYDPPGTPSYPGQEILLDTWVAPSGGGAVASGDVVFYDGAARLGSATLDGAGHARAELFPAVGTHHYTSVYSGSEAYAGSTSPVLVHEVRQSGTGIQITGGQGGWVGEDVELSALVYSTSRGTVTLASGKLTFSLDGAEFDVEQLPPNSNGAEITFPAPAAGTHRLTVAYSDDPNYEHASAEQALTVSRWTATMSQQSSVGGTPYSCPPAPPGQPESPCPQSRQGDPVTFSAFVDPARGGEHLDIPPPAGTVTFYEYGRTDVGLGTVPVVDGRADLTVNLPPGMHWIGAGYNGDDDYEPIAFNSIIPHQVVPRSGGTALPVDLSGAGTSRAGRGDGLSYRIVGADGKVATEGPVPAIAGLPARPARPVVGAASTPSGQGYWLVGADGGIFSFGDATFAGSSAFAAGSPAVAVIR